MTIVPKPNEMNVSLCAGVCFEVFQKILTLTKRRSLSSVHLVDFVLTIHN